MKGPTAHGGTLRFRALFDGRTDAHGIGLGGVVHEEVTTRMYADHLRGDGAAVNGGLGIFPVRDDDTVMFAAIDLDEQAPDTALALAHYMPDTVWIEQSRGKGYHVWAFFDEPCPAWVARAVLRGVTLAAGRTDIELFPKQETLREGMVGNYINLPLFGDERPILWRTGDEADLTPPGYTPETFINEANDDRACTALWTKRARALGASPPGDRAPAADFGTRARPHRCAEYVIAHAHDNPLTPGHRAVVLFNLAKQILNCENYDEEEAEYLVEAVNQAGTSPVPAGEVQRFVRNAARGEWTSTGCDDPAFQPYADPDCPIANG